MAPSNKSEHGGKRDNFRTKKSTNIMKVKGNHLAISAKRIYLVILIYLKHGKMQISRPGKDVVATVILPRFVVSG